MLRFIVTYIAIIASFAVSELYILQHYPNWLSSKTAGIIAIFLILGACIAASLKSWLGRFLLTVLFFFEFSQLFFYQFFQRYYGAADIALGREEARDTLQTFVGMQALFLPAWGIAALSAGFLVLAFQASKSAPQRKHYAYIALLIMVIHSIGIHNKDLHKADPSVQNLVVLNGFNANINYLSKLHGKALLPKEKFAPYQLTEIAHPQQPNIIYFFGESLNPDHMSNFGYERETTPQLFRMERSLNGAHKPIYAGGVFTRISTPMAFAVIREPKNIARYQTRDGHLVSAAKDQGYQTVITSSQTLDFLTATSPTSEFDYFLDWQTQRGMTDADLPDMVESVPVDSSKPYFWIINNRSPHSPYDEHIHPELAKYSLKTADNTAQKTINNYDDALRTTDKVIHDAIQAALKKSKRPTLIIITSDHGQLMNKNGQFGHGRLDLDVARTPLIAMWANWPEDWVREPIDCIANHYQLGKYLLNEIGYELINPNDNGQEYYVNGFQLYGMDKSLTYQVDSCNQQQLAGQLKRSKSAPVLAHGEASLLTE